MTLCCSSWFDVPEMK